MAKNNSDEPRTLEIRKYQNRRYYDSTRSRHLSLQQIHKLIIEGYNIRVLDAKTSEDITPKVLTQILLEYEPVKLDMFSNELLTRAIRVNDRLLKDFVDVYFRQAFEAFCGSQKQVDQMLRQAHHLSCPRPCRRPPTFSRRGCAFPLPFRPHRLRPASQMWIPDPLEYKTSWQRFAKRFRN